MSIICGFNRWDCLFSSSSLSDCSQHQVCDPPGDVKDRLDLLASMVQLSWFLWCLLRVMLMTVEQRHGAASGILNTPHLSIQLQLRTFKGSVLLP